MEPCLEKAGFLHYSYLSATTGLVLAVFSECQDTVRKVIAETVITARLTRTASVKNCWINLSFEEPTTFRIPTPLP